MQDVPGYLRRKELTFACYLDPLEAAVIDEQHAMRVNYETYLFATNAARETFRADVVRYCGLVTDPVTKRRFRPGEASPSYEHQGVLYYFEGLDEYEAFVARPDDYRLPGYVM